MAQDKTFDEIASTDPDGVDLSDGYQVQGRSVGSGMYDTGIDVIEDPDNNQLIFDLSDAPIGAYSVFEFHINVGNAGDTGVTEIRFNGDGDSNTDYTFWDMSGTETNDASGIMMWDSKNSSNHLGATVRASNTGGWAAASIEPMPGRGGVDNLGYAGGRTGNSGYIKSVEMHFPDSPTFDNITIPYYGIRQQL